MSKITVLIGIIFISVSISLGYYFFNQANLKKMGINHTSNRVLKEVSDLGLFNNGFTLFQGNIWSNELNKDVPREVKSYFKYYEFGEVTEGKHKGDKIYLVETNNISNMWIGRIFNEINEDTAEVVENYFIAVNKDGSFVLYWKDEDGLDVQTRDLLREDIKRVVVAEKFRGYEEFPLGIDFKREFKVNDSSNFVIDNISLSGISNFLSLKNLQENKNLKIKKLSQNIEGYNLYEVRNEVVSAFGYALEKDGIVLIYQNYLIDTKSYLSSISSSKLKLAEPEFNKYGYLLSGACSTKLYEIPSSVTSIDNLEKVSSSEGLEIYRIKDLNSPQNKEFVSKILEFYYYPDYEKLKLPYEKSPDPKVLKRDGLLIYKDGAGNFRGLIQNDSIEMRGGCGKPVIYLYPEKETEVTLSFKDKVKFENVIPSYQDNWKVLATPDGKLKDLKSWLTDCNLLGRKVGTEYSKIACDKNEYPYLYWSGNTVNNFYPSSKTGFIVKRENLNNFFDEKLSLMNFNKNEIKDFKEYWVTYLENKNSEYLRITFFQNEIVDKMFPISVTPQPDTKIRMFMDWDYAESSSVIEGQKLKSYPRNGFTLVEWGGLKK